MEEWRDIKGYEGLYQVSTMGRVKSIRYGKERILKPNEDGWGYFRVRLFKNGQRKAYKVHRLVAEAFLDNPDNLPQVNHKNEDKSDNRVENLEFCDCRYNINYGTGIQRRAKKQSKTVYQYSLDGQLIKEYPSVHEVERQLGYAQTYISKCCLDKCKQAYGYKWSYKL